MIETGEIICEKVYASPRPPPKTSLKDNWMKELDSKVGGGSEDSQQIQPKSKTQLSRSVRPVSEQPSGSFTRLEEIDIDFRVSGLPHAVVKEAEHFRVQELYKGSKIILIGTHFKPTCSKITSTTHSVTIRKR